MYIILYVFVLIIFYYSWQQPQRNFTDSGRDIGHNNSNNTDPRHYESKRYRNPPASYPGRKRMPVPTQSSHDDEGDEQTYPGHKRIPSDSTKPNFFNNNFPKEPSFDDESPRRKRLPPTIPTKSLFDDEIHPSHKPSKQPNLAPEEYPGHKRLPTPGQQSLFDDAIPVPSPTKSSFDDDFSSMHPEITERISQDSTIPMEYDFDKIDQTTKRKQFKPKKTHFVTPKYNPDDYGFAKQNKKVPKFPVS